VNGGGVLWGVVGVGYALDFIHGGRFPVFGGGCGLFGLFPYAGFFQGFINNIIHKIIYSF
jgi:hypothetical protein